ncbi:hypothetical protein [Phenylobacterium sp.]|jgi:hypothetical protein|uniref:hypothetical protein n=1 Tax=Phenylobacterium sp. TaxID=1871053 RepID=UPI002E3302BD|nr:hypothetical protein [Phenylobacterium sp.]HEX4712979.1 hypothetical protein [Phenylobacterium sp.]
MVLRALFLGLLICLVGPGWACADPAPFDLAGPKLQVAVTRAGVTLPIADVPNLAAGDRLSIKTGPPAVQSVRLLLVVAFLRGATDPPPETWFYRSEPGTKAGRDGLNIAVPAGAKQVVVFLAPRTGGDFKTIIDAVRGRPGAFVRASQDLNQAALDRARLDAFLAAVRKRDPADPDRLKRITPLLARSLTIKLNAECFEKMAELQAACLTQGQDSLVLNDGHSASLVQTLTSGDLTDLTLQLSSTPQAHFGYYSPYIGAVTDIAHILDSLHTAHYQYVPALATVRDGDLALQLNTPPSFHDPMSVLVAALPAIGPSQAPPLEPVDPKAVSCAARSDLVLPVEGAPLVYATQFAHDLTLRLKAKSGQTVDLPVRADAEKGGLIVDTGAFRAGDLAETLGGTLHGHWGFEPFVGPRFLLQGAQGASWRLSAGDEQALVVGRDNTIHLDGPTAECVSGVTWRQAGGPSQPAVWKAVAPDKLTATLPLGSAHAGELTLQVQQFGAPTAQTLSLRGFAPTGHIESFTLHAGDLAGELKGARLDEVAKLDLGSLEFSPRALTSRGGADGLSLATVDAKGAAALKAGQSFTAKIVFVDGRSASLKARIAPPRPKVTLIDKSVRLGPQSGPIAIELTDSNEIPSSAQLTFSVRAEPPMRYSGHETVEVATVDGQVSTALTAAKGLTVADPQVALATLDLGKAFNASTFGGLQFRVVTDEGASDWHPLAMLVRLPDLRALTCQPGRDQACLLTGSNLFLIDAVSGDGGFDNAVKVPAGFPGQTLSVPHPTSGRLYVKLHDDPAPINQAIVPPEHGAAAPPAGG